ncbi:amidohydrolase family protein [Rahnella bonaserana]|uniref:Amidohydrolase family protein n=1 Tax=Rahnella bonaserana TaxID=2816248 RepID=A0ABS6LUE7_9GAMM|nr:amidohydrolase family protein [Rahnella bonaserana]MBU9855725.1 amidohydrolase family protein [Rahnella bonaserana]WHZ38879.1 amidohydrolase family protein [Rahnella bonaserana]
MSSDSLLIKNAHAILTGLPGDAARHTGPDIRVCHGVIEAMGTLTALPGERLVDARDCVVYPAWVNTHHHLFQSLLKGEPQGLNKSLTAWLSATPYRFRATFDESTFRLAVRIGLTELLRSGCATVADHNYLYWPDMPFDTSEILFSEGEALGMRIVLCRGGATQGRAIEKELPQALRPEGFADYMADMERLVGRYHDPKPTSLRRVVMAPTTLLHSAPGAQLREMAKLARSLGIRLHSHLSETVDYLDAARAKFDMTPVQFCAEHDWLGDDVWFAHLVKLLPQEIAMLGQTRTGIAHCPQSNGRLGSGIADLLALEQAGVPVSLGVDGAASNEAADMQSEAHAAWLLQRARKGMLAKPRYDGGTFEGGGDAASIEDVVRWGSGGGAQILGLQQSGTVQAGMLADIAIYRLDDPRYFGLHDMAIGPVACGGRASLKALMINGRIIVENDVIPGLDLDAMRHDAMSAVRTLQQRAAR